MYGGALRDRVAEYRVHFGEYLLFFVLTLIVWANVDLARFLLLREKPAAAEVLWAAAIYTAVWMAVWVVREMASGLARAREETKGPEREASVTGQEVAQES